MMPVRVLFILLCAAILSGAFYLSSQGVWGASSSVSSVRSGSYGGIGAGRVK